MCSKEEKNYRPDRNKSYVCGSCTHRLSNFSQEELLKGHKIATDKNLEDKIKALEMFIVDYPSEESEDTDGKEGTEGEISGGVYLGGGSTPSIRAKRQQAGIG